jgi:hypothetical protein
MRRRFLLAAALALVLALGAACNDDNDNGDGVTPPPETPAATATPEPDPTATPPPGPSDNATINRIVAAVEAEDYDALRGFVLFRLMPCVDEPEGIGAPPECLEGEDEGDLVEVFPAAQCEGWFVRPDDLDTTSFPARDTQLYGVYETTPEHYPEGNYAIIFRGGAGTSGDAWQLVASDAGITGIHYGCAQSPAQMVEFQRLEVALVPPQQ